MSRNIVPSVRESYARRFITFSPFSSLSRSFASPKLLPLPLLYDICPLRALETTPQAFHRLPRCAAMLSLPTGHFEDASHR
jgi:hypothetical protein